MTFGHMCPLATLHTGYWQHNYFWVTCHNQPNEQCNVYNLTCVHTCKGTIMYVPYLSPCSTSFKYILGRHHAVDIGPGAKLKRYRRLIATFAI